MSANRQAYEGLSSLESTISLHNASIFMYAVKEDAHGKACELHCEYVHRDVHMCALISNCTHCLHQWLSDWAYYHPLFSSVKRLQALFLSPGLERSPLYRCYPPFFSICNTVLSDIMLFPQLHLILCHTQTYNALHE